MKNVRSNTRNTEGYINHGKKGHFKSNICHSRPLIKVHKIINRTAFKNDNHWSTEAPNYNRWCVH